MKNKVCLITGATSGLGKATAIALGGLGATLLLVGRNTERGLHIVDYLKRKSGNKNVRFFKTDISLQKEVHELTDEVTKHYDHIDVLVNNAGARFSTYTKTTEGLEQTFAVNYISHFLLTMLLLEKLGRAPGARIINTSSGAHWVSKGEFEKMFHPQTYDRQMAYANSKLANILFTYELAHRLKHTPINVNALHPGGVVTRIGMNDGFLRWSKHIIYYMLKGQLITSRKGAEAITWLASSPDVQGLSGMYFYKKNKVESSRLSYNKELALKLWDLSLELTKVSDQTLSFAGSIF